ncbi:protein disulfide oxidoreductase [Bergeriella denitrificans]|uniref:Periplasmic thioredoxin n=1 Tax=Bergeriella denitrificans TaxID=494 RepID=A0A378UL66_BERDE|nr:protein disulfide oxidoreductase [Bergeriella denitrificans]STZ77433.1 periplasmic thioredoxin [Bergeriella denitrificans]
MKTLRTYLWHFLQALALFAVISFAVDRWRAPVQPDWPTAQPLQTLAQQSVSLDEISRRQTAVLYFWGSWCGICRYTSPDVEKLHQAGIPVLGVALRSGSDADVAAYMRQHGLTFPNVNDADGNLSRQWQIAVTPTVVLLKNGRMVHHTTGFGSYWGLRLRIWLADAFA